eukprot:scaffold659_cov192-Ochromonas_danica.AAC.6
MEVVDCDDDAVVVVVVDCVRVLPVLLLFAPNAAHCAGTSGGRNRNFENPETTEVKGVWVGWEVKALFASSHVKRLPSLLTLLIKLSCNHC